MFLGADPEERQHFQPRFGETERADQIEKTRASLVTADAFRGLGHRDHRIDPNLREVAQSDHHALPHARAAYRVMRRGVIAIETYAQIERVFARIAQLAQLPADLLAQEHAV